MTSAELGEMIYLEPSDEPTVTLLKAPRKLKKKMKKQGSWTMPVFTVTEVPMNFIKDFEVWKG